MKIFYIASDKKKIILCKIKTFIYGMKLGNLQKGRQ